jgi:8-amino-7-oxononanoate synthase
VTWEESIAARLQAVRDAAQWRAPVSFDAAGPAGVLGGRPVVSFASNDYLGLSIHPSVVAAASAAIDRWGTGSGASRLVTGSRPVHGELEEELAAWTGEAAAVCFPTGFAANLAVLSVLGTPGTRILSDQRNHASIVDGCRLSRADVTVYRHCDVDQVERLLAGPGGPAVVVTDRVFSMDGDHAPVAELAAACARHDAVLVLDEAHAVLAHDAPPDCLTVRVGTLSKTLGSLGGFVAADQPVADLLVNAGRPYIFTTALTPADAAAALAAVRIVRSAEGEALRRRLSGLVDRVRPAHGSPILPVVLGSEERALSASADLLAQGLWVPAIRPPTVAPGTSRLRVTFSAAHTDEQVDRLAKALAAA